jgi:hypothetical protein
MKKNAPRLRLKAFFFKYYDQVLNNLYIYFPYIYISDQRERNITTGLFGLSNEIIRIIFYTKVCNIMSDADY